jgi:hypothetical protein
MRKRSTGFFDDQVRNLAASDRIQRFIVGKSDSVPPCETENAARTVSARRFASFDVFCEMFWRLNSRPAD